MERLNLPNCNRRWHTLPMLKNSPRMFLSAAVASVTIAMVPMPAGNAAVGEILGRLPAGEISCDQAAANWTNDGDYQARVAQAQTIAAIDPRGNQILAALGRVDAAAEQCGLKGTVSTGGGTTPDTGVTDSGTADTPAAGEQSGTDDGTNPGNPGGADTAADGTAADSDGTITTPPAGGGGTPDAPVTDAEAILGPIRNNPTTPMKTIEVLGQGQIEVADADAMMSNFLRQFTIII